MFGCSIWLNLFVPYCADLGAMVLTRYQCPVFDQPSLRVPLRLRRLRDKAYKRTQQQTGKRQEKIFLEFWVGPRHLGGGRVGKAVEQLGWPVLQFDNTEDALDATHPAVFAEVRTWIGNGMVAGVFLAPPCTTWSIASQRPPLRDHYYLYGCPGLSDALQEKVQQGNHEIQIAFRLWASAAAADVPTMLEHPASSRIWQCDPNDWEPTAADLFYEGVLDTIHQCRYGAPWRKPTNFFSLNTKPAWEASLMTCFWGPACHGTRPPIRQDPAQQGVRKG